ncbi:MAG: hypothetical protein EBS73_17440, partial [Betaproteobacteria bacterium]|nr:hypothetical protein [Betaproteobacteria bacterium]
MTVYVDRRLRNESMHTIATLRRHSSLPVQPLSGLTVPSAFSPYAIAFFDTNAEKAKFIKQLHYGLRLRGPQLDVSYTVFTPKKRSVLAFELGVVPHRACYLVGTEADEIIGLRYLAAGIALAKTHRKVSATKFFCKPTKKVASVSTRDAQVLASVTQELEDMVQQLDQQQDALWAALDEALVVKPTLLNTSPKHMRT